MWLIVKPLSESEELGLLTSSIEVEDEIPNCNVTSFGYKILREIIRKAAPATISQMSRNAESVALRWFLFILNKIFASSNNNPVYHNVPSQGKKHMMGEDMEWAINNLTKEAFLHTLCSCFWDIYSVQEMTTAEATLTHQACLHFLTELGDDNLRKSEECWESSSVDNSLSFHLTYEGKLVLLNWVSEILTRAMNIAGKERCKPGLKRITAADMFWCLNWARLNLVLATPFSINDQDKNNNKRKRTSDHTASVYNYDSSSKTYLPQDLLNSHIFPNLPLKSLLRFKCVCKEWKETISSSYLRCSQQTQQDHTTISIAIFNSGHKAMNKDIKSECDGLDVFMVDTVSYKGRSIKFYGSCCGLLCFAIPIGRMKWRFTIGNPVTKKWHVLPPTIYPLSTSNHLDNGPGLAVDTSTNSPSYKLVVPSFGEQSPWFQVFSSETWQWKAMYVKTDPKIDLATGIKKDEHYSEYIDGVLYYSTGFLRSSKIVWLDLGKEMMGTISLPHKQTFERRAFGSLESLGGRKRLTCCMNVGGGRLEIYVLMDKNEWEIWLSVNARGSFSTYFEPYPYYGGEIVVVNVCEYIYAYNLKTKEWKRIGRDKYKRITGTKSFPYKMSLLPLPKVKISLELVKKKKTKKKR